MENEKTGKREQQNRIKSMILAIVVFLVIGLIVLSERVLGAGNNGSLLFTLVFWIAIIEGCIALVATTELVKAQWILPLKKGLLSVYPLLLFIAFLFIFLVLQINIYPWAEGQGIWLNKWFFMIRNFILLLLAYVLARKLAIESDKESKKRDLYAILYLLVFVVSQSLVAFDWVMPLEYPWFSTLFGGYFFVESFYVGIAVAGVFCFLLLKKSAQENADKLSKALNDTATMMFGFSLLWAGLFYSQFLVIWYGNIPEEAGFLVARISNPLSYVILVALFFAPFIILLSRRAKSNPSVVLAVSSAILLGLFIERLLLLFPAVPLNPILLVLEFLLISFLFVVQIHRIPATT